MTPTQLRHWLRRSPTPARIRADGQILEIPQTPYRWSELASSIEALGASRIECLSDSGAVIRAASMDAGGPEAPDPAEVAAAREERAERDRVREAVEIARVVAEASERATRQHAETYSRVLERYEGLVSLVVQRLTSLERAYHSALVQAARAQSEAILVRAEAEAEAAQQQDQGLAPLLTAVAGSLLSGDSGQSPPKPNGKA